MLAVLSTITRGLTPSKSTDTDLLLSMPIKKRKLLLAIVFQNIFLNCFLDYSLVLYVIMYFILVKFTLQVLSVRYWLSFYCHYYQWGFQIF